MPMPRKRPLEDPKQYYAYVWRLDGEVLWVGQGKDNRGRPTCSACWNGRPESLRRLLKARAKDINWEVIPCESKTESETIERTLIANLSPKFNTAPQKGGWKGMHTPRGITNISKAQRGRVPTAAEREVRRQNMIRLNLKRRQQCTSSLET